MKVIQERTYSGSSSADEALSKHTLCDIHHGSGSFRIKMSGKSYQRLN